MIAAIEKNLQRGIKLLENISDEQYSNCTIPPYYSSIGNNMRHVLDIFACIFDGMQEGIIDFSKRKRNEAAQQYTLSGLDYFNEVIAKLKTVQTSELDKKIKVTDDLGTGMITTQYTLGSALCQAHSHAIHHFASIGFIIEQLGIELPDADFGYNPTTPKKIEAE